MQMDKNIIKKLLRESLENMFSESEELLAEKSIRQAKKEHKKNIKKDYEDIKTYFRKSPSFSQVDVMISALGLPDDEDGTNRSLFSKKLRQKKNPDTGSLYQFDDLELDKIRTAIKLK